MLSVSDLCVSYGEVEALHGVSLEVGDDEIVALIGSNGAGKSTLLYTISRLLRPSSGSISYNGVSLGNIPPEDVVALGVSLIPEGRRIFTGMSVFENLLIGAHLPQNQKTFTKNLERVYILFPRLEERRKQSAATLSGGEQQMLAIGRGLMSNPKLLLLDEPSLGLAPVLVEEVYQVIVEIKNSGTAILVVEQNAFQALSVANRGYVIETGNITHHNKALDLLEDETIRHAYLGE